MVTPKNSRTRAKKKQQALLSERLKKADVIVSTANIPGRKAPILITEETVRGMRAGSVMVITAAASGGNCPLTRADEIIQVQGISIVGWTNYPAMLPSDSSSFFARNIWNLVGLMLNESNSSLQLPLEDDIVDAVLICHNGNTRLKAK